MSSSLSRRTPGADARARMCSVAIAVALVVGGCAAQSGPSKVAGPVAYPGDPAPRPPITPTKVVIEADGLPSQLAPKNPRPFPDDPTEPWSPNYGSMRANSSFEPDAAPARASAVAPKAVAMATTQTVAPVRVVSSSTPSLDPDDIIRIAVAAHEMRHR